MFLRIVIGDGTLAWRWVEGAFLQVCIHTGHRGCGQCRN